MTDTVNVPQEMIDAVMKVPVGLDEDGAEVFPGPFAAAELVRVALAAAPKSEPIGRNITFSPNAEGVGEAVISPDVPEGPYWTLIGQGGDDDQNRIAAEIVRRLNSGHPEAPKVEQEPVGWDHKYRPLKKGEIILASDEVQHDDGSWHPSASVGQEAPDPSYTSHRVYRRLKHPAPASDELLEALERADAAISGADISKIRHSEGGVDLAKKVVDLKAASQNLIAKHKEPQ